MDKAGNKWIGTFGGGAAKFDDKNWTIYTASNSKLADNIVHIIKIDRFGNKWIGTQNGLSVFNEKGVSLFVDKKTNMPGDYLLMQNYPNPFNPVTTIKYELPGELKVTLALYNTLGQKVKELVNEIKPSGANEVLLDGAGLPSGIYFYRLQAGRFSQTKKLILLK